VEIAAYFAAGKYSLYGRRAQRVNPARKSMGRISAPGSQNNKIEPLNRNAPVSAARV
jgi:hypothetical protein